MPENKSIDRKITKTKEISGFPIAAYLKGHKIGRLGYAILLGFMVFLLGANQAKASTLTVQKKQAPSQRKLSLNVAYYEDFPNRYGMSTGVEYVFWSRCGGSCEAYVDGKLSFHEHQGSHLGIQLIASIGFRYTFGFGLFFDTDLGGGYTHAWLHGTVFERHEGQIRESSHNWTGAGIVMARLGFGWDVGQNINLPLSVFFRLGTGLEAPYNNTFVPHFTGEFGLRYNFGG